MTKHAKGPFEVKLDPQSDDTVGAPSIGRMSLDKQFRGDLEGTSKGQMLAVSTDVQGSAGYVAMERVNGKVHGRSVSFALQHSGTMTRGTPQLTITVVPDSGTDRGYRPDKSGLNPWLLYGTPSAFTYPLSQVVLTKPAL
jgi:hypothetical protein